MTITNEVLKTIYQRANQYAITMYGPEMHSSEPDKLELDSDGTITARWIDYRCGDIDETCRTITAENLSEDLDSVAAQRLKKEEEERIKRQIQQEEEKRKKEERDLLERKTQYLKLKQEFEK